MRSDYIENQVFLECTCGCGVLRVTQYKDDNMVYIEYLTPNFYSMQLTCFDKIKRALKMAWFIIRGKEFLLYDILIDDNNKLDEFKEFVAGIGAIKKENNHGQ